MSTFEAIGGVSGTLQTLLANAMDSPPGVSPALTPPLPVSIGIPPKEEDIDGDPLLNLFLYRVTENPFLENQQIPGRGQPDRYGHPPLSLNLHYLITPYGHKGGPPPAATPTDERIAQHLLGSAMRVLHDNPVITEGSIVNGNPVLDTSLEGEYEKVKLTLEPLSIEDVSKVWTALTRPYRLSAAYAVSVVQIESRARRRFPQLVGQLPDAGPRVPAITGRGPGIREVRGRRLSGPYASVGDELMVLGSDLAGPVTLVTLGAVDATGDIASVTADRLVLRVPDDFALQPGAHRVVVKHAVELGSPPARRIARRSNSGVFVLAPRLEQLDPQLGMSPPRVRLRGTRLFAPDLECMALIGDEVVASADWLNATPTDITVPVPSTLGSGDYAVRVRVNEAESLDGQVLTIP